MNGAKPTLLIRNANLSPQLRDQLADQIGRVVAAEIGKFRDQARALFAELRAELAEAKLTAAQLEHRLQDIERERAAGIRRVA